MVATLPLLAGTAARASTPDCSVSSDALTCRLTGVLHWLEAAAFILAIILVAVIAIAVHLVRKNRLSRKAGR